jgi:hypothetical protein
MFGFSWMPYCSVEALSHSSAGLLAKGEAEIIMRLSKIRVIAVRLFEHSLSCHKFPNVHDIDVFVVSLESQLGRRAGYCPWLLHLLQTTFLGPSRMQYRDR